MILSNVLQQPITSTDPSSRSSKQPTLFPEFEFRVYRPFLKWAGGKRQLLPVILPRVPSVRKGRYHEPFLGGGAVFFALKERGLLGTKKARLSDINQELVNAYQVVRDDVESLIGLLKTHKNEEEYYYKMRALDPQTLDPLERASRLIYLNKTCFNGLFRENQKGQFNVPFGRYPHPQICDAEVLLSAHYALKGTTIEVASFEETFEAAASGDFVYFDPPYAPLSPTSSFVNYHAGGFHEKEHIQLADGIQKLAERGVNVMASNSSVPWIRTLYQDCFTEEVLASRSINSRSDKRGRVLELLIHAGPYAKAFQRSPQAFLEWHLGESNPEPYAYEASALTS